MNTLLVTGSSGLIGSEVVDYFCRRAWTVHGIDNNMRRDFFGSAGDTRWNQNRLQKLHSNYKHHDLDVRNRHSILECVGQLRPILVVHAAAQPSHDLAAKRPFDDFDVNAVGTLNLLEAVRRCSPEAVFIYLSTNKVYGDRPNNIPMRELDTRWDYSGSNYVDGIAEDFPIDQSKHSLFGASKVAADVLVQEYGRYFGLRTACLRGGCLTGPNHSGVELHGFLNYLCRCNVTGAKYTIYGYKGKQVRDNIHAYDVARFIDFFWMTPQCGEVYNIGGGRPNSLSILEAFDQVASLTGKKMIFDYLDKNREGDHICYISDVRKMRGHYPEWSVTKSLEDIFTETICALKSIH